MDVDAYQTKTVLTEVYSDSIHEFTRNAGSPIILWEALRIQYVALGLVGEAGEIANKVKKQIRDNPLNAFDTNFKEDIENELGDLMWYISQLCNELGLSLHEVMRYNISKLTDREERGTLRGSGDNR